MAKWQIAFRITAKWLHCVTFPSQYLYFFFVFLSLLLPVLSSNWLFSRKYLWQNPHSNRKTGILCTSTWHTTFEDMQHNRAFKRMHCISHTPRTCTAAHTKPTNQSFVHLYVCCFLFDIHTWSSINNKIRTVEIALHIHKDFWSLILVARCSLHYTNIPKEFKTKNRQ